MQKSKTVQELTPRETSMVSAYRHTALAGQIGQVLKSFVTIEDADLKKLNEQLKDAREALEEKEDSAIREQIQNLREQIAVVKGQKAEKLAPHVLKTYEKRNAKGVAKYLLDTKIPSQFGKIGVDVFQPVESIDGNILIEKQVARAKARKQK